MTSEKPKTMADMTQAGGAAPSSAPAGGVATPSTGGLVSGVEKLFHGAVKQLTELLGAQKAALAAGTHNDADSPHVALGAAWDARTDEDVKVEASAVVHGAKTQEQAIKDLQAKQSAVESK